MPHVVKYIMKIKFKLLRSRSFNKGQLKKFQNEEKKLNTKKKTERKTH